jgi:integrase
MSGSATRDRHERASEGAPPRLENGMRLPATLVDTNPFTNLRLPESRGRKDLIVPTEAEVDAMIVAAAKKWREYGRQVYGPMLEIAAYTGVRPGELYALRFTDVDWTRNTLMVERQYNTRTGGLSAPKNGQARTLALHPRAANAIGRMVKVREEIASTPQGQMFTGRVAHYYFDPIRCMVGRPELDFYSLRHFYGTFLARLGPEYGIGPIEIAQALGHTDGGKLAMDRYIHLTDVEARGKLHKAFERQATVPLRAVSGANRGQEGHNGA